MLCGPDTPSSTANISIDGQGGKADPYFSQVYVRVRPFNSKEVSRNATCIVKASDPSVTLLRPNPSILLPPTPPSPSPSPGVVKRQSVSAPVQEGDIKAFTFDRVFWSFDGEVDGVTSPVDGQEVVYEAVKGDILDHAFAGYNVCLFAYGQTGSGKSYTMMGYGKEKGIIPRACEELFSRIQENSDPNVRFEVTVSYIEIYNEKVRDLLNPSNTGNLRVREHPTLGPYVEDLSKLVVRRYDDVENLMEVGNKSRTVASTNMNETSSRSHAVFTVNLTQTRQEVSSSLRTERISRISLVDLAGSERADATGARGQRLKEGANINKSLTTLGKVISGLADLASGEKEKDKEREKDKEGTESGGLKRTLSQKRSRVLEPFIPYRDSTLTWLLKDCIGGNSKTIMLAAIAPTDTSFDETLSTLRYAERAKRIVNRAVVNEDTGGVGGKVVKELREEIDRLRVRLGAFENFGDGVEGESLAERAKASVATKELETVKEQLEASEKLVAELTQSYEEKLRRTLEIERERDRALQDLGITVVASRPTSSLSLQGPLSPNQENPPLLSPSSTSASVSTTTVGVHAPRTIPHLVNLGEDITDECLLYRLPAPGWHRVGSDAERCSIVLRGDLEGDHAFFECAFVEEEKDFIEEPEDGQEPNSRRSSIAKPSSSATTPIAVYLHPSSPQAVTHVNGNLLSGPSKLVSGSRITFGTSGKHMFRFTNPVDSFGKSGGSSSRATTPPTTGAVTPVLGGIEFFDRMANLTSGQASTPVSPIEGFSSFVATPTALHLAAHATAGPGTEAASPIAIHQTAPSPAQPPVGTPQNGRGYWGVQYHYHAYHGPTSPGSPASPRMQTEVSSGENAPSPPSTLLTGADKDEFIESPSSRSSRKGDDGGSTSPVTSRRGSPSLRTPKRGDFSYDSDMSPSTLGRRSQHGVSWSLPSASADSLSVASIDSGTPRRRISAKSRLAGGGSAVVKWTERQRSLAAGACVRWGSRCYVKLSQEIAKCSPLLKEVNVIAKELRKDVHFDVVIIPPGEPLNPISFWEAGSKPDMALFSFSDYEADSTSVAFKTPGLLQAARSRQPSLAVRVLNGRDNAIFHIPLSTLKRRLPAMKAEYEITDLAKSFYVANRGLRTAESVFYSADPNFPPPNRSEGGEGESPTSASLTSAGLPVTAPWFDRIGVAKVCMRNVLHGLARESKVPVLNQDGSAKGWLRVVVTPISSHPPPSDDVDVIEDGESFTESHHSSRGSGTIVLEISVVEVEGILESEFTQVHCQFRIGDLIGEGNEAIEPNLHGMGASVLRSNSMIHTGNIVPYGGVFEDESDSDRASPSSDIMSPHTRERLFCTDPVSDFGDQPVRWEFTQTVIVPLTDSVRSIIQHGLIKFEIFGRRIRSVVNFIDMTYRMGVEEPRRLIGNAASAIPPLSAQTDGVGGTASSTPLTEQAHPYGVVRETVGKAFGTAESTHFVLSQLQILELGHQEFKEVPVQVGAGNGSTGTNLGLGWKSLLPRTTGKATKDVDELVEEPLDIFLLRQGLQRRLIIKLSHASGSMGLPFRRLVYVRMGKTRRFDLRTGLAMEEENSDTVDLALSSPAGVISTSLNGCTTLEFSTSWDSSVHGNIHLNKASKQWKIRMVLEFGIELMDSSQPSYLGKLSQLDIPRSSSMKRPSRILEFSMPFEILMHERDYKVRASAQILEFFASSGLGLTSSRFLRFARCVYSVAVRHADSLPSATASGRFRRTRSGSFSFSTQDEDTRQGSASKSFDERHALVRTRSSSNLPKAERGNSVQTPHYIRGEENLGLWKPKNSAAILQYVLSRHAVDRLSELEVIKQRIEESLVDSIHFKADEKPDIIRDVPAHSDQFEDASPDSEIGAADSTVSNIDVTEDSETAGRSGRVRNERDSFALLRKCVDMWRWASPSRKLDLETLLQYEMPTAPAPKATTTAKKTRTADSEFAIVVSRVQLGSPVSLKGFLSTPNQDGVWVKRYFILRRPCLYMYATPSDLDEMAVFGLPNSSVQYGPELGALFQQKENVFALLGQHSTLILQAEKQTDMDSWLSALDPLHVGAMLSKGILKERPQYAL
ncbi:hypothetical protein HDU97_002120 [Phlyctochytrium planicorne]|nr:hypothetical protein HDU97_002120 [Phlyctochytrium planicorne]